ncbi:MAG: hypothetical protein BWY52_02081 [Chloroflexi bacterium ADurb.Bin325]|nr:MAG: hypothetical protein BWY52_02081 [Chloroflexi bacterium ADurb.Bin325]
MKVKNFAAENTERTAFFSLHSSVASVTSVAKRRSFLLLALVALVALTGCQAMANQPRYDPLEASAFFADGQSARPQVDGSIARGQLRTDSVLDTGQLNGAASEEFPFELTAAVLERGRQEFEIYCTPCHGYTGAGDGMVVQRGFPAPQTFHQDRLRTAPPGYFFQIITTGFGRMQPYASQVPDVADRWAIVAYVRALQLSQAAPADALPAEDLQRLQEASQ